MEVTRTRPRPPLPPQAVPGTNRSLGRGLQILSCFRPGISSLSNGELVERTGLPKATVSRLTQTLVHSGFLRHDEQRGSFRLAFSLLSLAHSAMLASGIERDIAPLMKKMAKAHRVNVGLSVPDGLEMLYLHVAHEDPSRLTRRIQPGHRKFIATNAVGHAYLAMLDSRQRALKMQALQQHCTLNWEPIRQSIEAAAKAYPHHHWCSVLWSHATRSVATAIEVRGDIYVLNMSFSDAAYPMESLQQTLIPELLALREEIKAVLAN